jgi:hypothetical protein
MKVKATWRNKNLFSPRIEDLGRVSEADVDDDMPFEDIEDFAKEATPDGFFLKQIEYGTETAQYSMNGEKLS